MKEFAKFAVAVSAMVLASVLSSPSWSQSIETDPLVEVPQDAVDPPPTFEEKLKLAKEGDIDIQISLAKDYLSGDNDTPVRPVDAARWLTTASEKGNAEAQFLLANLLREGAKGLKANPKKCRHPVCQCSRKGTRRSGLLGG